MTKPRVTLIESFDSWQIITEKLIDRRITEPSISKNSKIQKLTEIMRAEKDVGIRNRMMVILEALNGHSTKIASDFVGVDRQTVQLWAASQTWRWIKHKAGRKGEGISRHTEYKDEDESDQFIEELKQKGTHTIRKRKDGNGKVKISYSIAEYDPKRKGIDD